MQTLTVPLSKLPNTATQTCRQTQLPKPVAKHRYLNLPPNTATQTCRQTQLPKPATKHSSSELSRQPQLLTTMWPNTVLQTLLPNTAPQSLVANHSSLDNSAKHSSSKPCRHSFSDNPAETGRI